MSYCMNCGSALAENSSFCAHCGIKIILSEGMRSIPPNLPISPNESLPPKPLDENRLSGGTPQKTHSKLLVPGIALTANGGAIVGEGLLVMGNGQVAFYILSLEVLIIGLTLLSIGIPFLIVGLVRNRRYHKTHGRRIRIIARHIKYIIAGIVVTCVGLFPILSTFTTYELGGFAGPGPSPATLELFSQHIGVASVSLVIVAIGICLFVMASINYKLFRRGRI